MDCSLRNNIHLLKWNKVDIEEVGATDFFYTDGSACGSSFKLVFRKNGINDYLTTIYVFSNGYIFGGLPEIRELVITWIDQIKTLRPVSSSSEINQEEDPQTISKDILPAHLENHILTSPPTN